MAAASLGVAVLSLGFAMLQMLHRPDPAPAMLAVPPLADGQPAVAGPAIAGVTVSGSGPVANPRREVQGTVKVLEPNYTVQAGDTLNRIAARFDTTVERIQALNDLADPRALRIGTQLVIPPPLSS